MTTTKTTAPADNNRQEQNSELTVNERREYEQTERDARELLTSSRTADSDVDTPLQQKLEKFSKAFSQVCKKPPTEDERRNLDSLRLELINCSETFKKRLSSKAPHTRQQTENAETSQETSTASTQSEWTYLRTEFAQLRARINWDVINRTCIGSQICANETWRDEFDSILRNGKVLASHSTGDSGIKAEGDGKWVIKICLPKATFLGVDNTISLLASISSSSSSSSSELVLVFDQVCKRH
jgi:hypothetical protein